VLYEKPILVPLPPTHLIWTGLVSIPYLCCENDMNNNDKKKQKRTEENKEKGKENTKVNKGKSHNKRVN
jgi:hypothetical protein